MRNCTSIFVGFIGIVFCIGCQKDNDPVPTPMPSMIPIFDLGDTVRNNNTTSYEEVRVGIDSAFQFGFKLTSSHGFKPNEWSAYFIRIEFKFQDEIKFLDSLAYGGYVFAGPLLSTFDYGDTINDVTLANQTIFDWFPQFDAQMGNTGWLKYHIYATGPAPKENIKIGENYLVFKFGAAGNERMGWAKIVYQDTICFLKEGYYESKPNQGIIVGIK